MADHRPKLEKLIHEEDSKAEPNKALIIEWLKLADTIYYTGNSATLNGKIYHFSDMPGDKFYDSMRKKYTPDLDITELYVQKSDDKGKPKDVIKHPYPMGSLSKVVGVDIDGFRNGKYAKFSRFRSKDSLFVSAKADGNSLRVWYENGRLIQALTRYDRQYGKDKFRKARYFVTRPDVSFQGKIAVRGEVVMKGDDHTDLGYTTRLAGVSGLMGQKDNRKVRGYLHFVAYELTEYEPAKIPSMSVWPESKPGRMDEMFDLMEKLGFEVVPHKNTSLGKISEKSVTKQIKEWSDELDYDIDGIVLSTQDSMEEKSDTPIFTVALKINSGGEWTVVTKIEARATRTGNVIPQIYVEPVEVDKFKIAELAGFNYVKILERGIREGSRVRVIRSGGVIPKIIEVDNKNVGGKELVPPTNCPACNSVLIKENRFLKCADASCPVKTSGGIEHFIKVLGIKDFGPARIERVGVHDVTILYEMTPADFRQKDGIGPKISKRLYAGLREAIKDVNEAKIFAALSNGIVGEKTARTILQYIPLKDLFGEEPPLRYKLKGMKGIGEKIAESVVNSHSAIRAKLLSLAYYGMRTNRRGIIDLKPDGTPVKENVGKLEIICLTGSGALRRDEYVEIIQTKGWRVASTVTKKTTLLVSDDPNSPTAKMIRAGELGIKVVPYEELHKLLGIEW